MKDKTDKIFSIYKQYQDLIVEDANKGTGIVYGVDQLAARLTVAHAIDNALDTLQNDKPPTANKINVTHTT